mmetsp:Transcript_414/g.1414  ORF Transcript_414/g.1414 Transcript_414/m.1414 type:complete len:123 (+) Transcript_414:115-483(+)
MLGHLELWVKSASSLKGTDFHDTPDPYCLVFVDGVQELKTKYIRNDVNPVWDEKMSMPARHARTFVKFVVMDKDRFTRDDFVGEAEVMFEDVYHLRQLDRSLPLLRKGSTVGYLHVSAKYTD